MNDLKLTPSRMNSSQRKLWFARAGSGTTKNVGKNVVVASDAMKSENRTNDDSAAADITAAAGKGRC